MNIFVSRILTAVIVAAMIMVPGLPASDSAIANSDADGVSVAEKMSAQNALAENAEYDSDELLVLVEKGTSKSEIRQIAEENDAELDNVNSLNDGTKMALLRAEDESIQDQIISIQSEDSVIIAQPNYKYKLQDNEVNDPEACSEQWYLKSPTQTAGGVDAYGAWDALQISDSDISSKPIVAVIDTGANLQHEDLEGCMLTDKCRSFYKGEVLGFTELDNSEDDNGHGTHVCGIIGAAKNNGKGIAGIAGNRVSIMCLDAFTVKREGGRVSQYFATEDIIKAIDYAVSNDAKVINMSLGGLYRDLLMERVINMAWNEGVLCVCAAGNENTSSIASPSDSPCAISVMNHNKEGNLADSSNYGVERDVSAPGQEIYSTYNESNSSYESMGGTSMASPVVAGFAALLLSEKGDLTPRQLKNLIYTSSGKDGFEPGKNSQNNGAGFGRINLKNGIDNLHALSSNAQPTKVVLNKTDVSMYVGESTSIEYEVLPGNTASVDATFESYNTSVAEVDEYGVVTAKSPGKAYILVKSGNKGMYCEITVGEVPFKQIDHIPYRDKDVFSESDPLAFVVNSAYYMHEYKIRLEKNETIQVCMQGEDKNSYDLYVRLVNSSGVFQNGSDHDKTKNGVKYENFSYTAGAAGEYKLQTVFGGTGDYNVDLSRYGYSLKIASNSVTTNPQVESDNGNAHISWNAAGDADGYIVKKYSDASCSSKISERDITGTACYESAGTSDCYYTVTPYIESAAGRLLCKESAPVKVIGEKTRTETTPKKNSAGASDNNKGTSSGKEQAAVSAKDLDEIVQARKIDNDIPGSAISPLFLKSKSCTKKSIKLVWKKAPGAAEYVIYGNACGKKNKLKKLARIKSTKFNAKKAVKKLKKSKYYKFMIVAASKTDKVVSVSKTIHVATKGSKKASNPMKVIVKAKISKSGKVTKKYRAVTSTVLKAGRTIKLKASFTKAKRSKVRKHTAMRYESSNTNVATVSSRGKITARANGKAKIYVYAQNGACKTISLLIK